MRRYGWWAAGVYFALSVADCGLTFAAIHFFGGDHVGDLERLVRKWTSLGGKTPCAEDGGAGDLKDDRQLTAGEKLITRLSTEFVIAYGIHKTVLLPVRAALTVAFTPAIVRWLIRRGWARPVKAAAYTAKSA
ncbi:DUF1279 super [Malassezia sp. CBS 17886]|nr:DUF1279 super [Malassezia sp. CBS 17886]